MASINSVVDIQIDRQTKFPTRVGFGTPLIVSENAAQDVGAVGSYNDLQGLTDEGFNVTDEAYLAARALFSQNPRPATVKIANRGEAESVADAMARISEVDNDYYFIISTSRTETDILAMAAYAEANTKAYFFETDEADSANLAHATDTTSILAQVKDLNLDRTIPMWTKTSNLDNYPSAAWVGKVGPKDPGSVTWKFKNLNLVVADDELTSTQIANIKGKNANVYITVAGVANTQEGTCASGEFIDIIRGTDKLSARMQESVFAVFLNEDKVPYTDAGAQVLVGAAKSPLDTAVDDGLLAGGDEAPVITVPKVLDIPQAERALRTFGDMEFTGRYAGAVHKLNIRGRITV